MEELVELPDDVGETFATASAAVDATALVAETVPAPTPMLFAATDATVEIPDADPDAVKELPAREENGASENADKENAIV